MITKRTVIGQLNVLEDGQIQVRTDTVIEEDGVELSRTFHRHVLEPGEDVSTRDEKSKLVAAAVWDAKTVAAYLAKKAALAAAAETRGIGK
jgi:hypothetical protein